MKNQVLLTICTILFFGGAMCVEANPLITLGGMILALLLGQFINVDELEDDDDVII